MDKAEKLVDKIFDLACWTDRIPVIGICGGGAAGTTKLTKSIAHLPWLDTTKIGTDWWFKQSTVLHRDFLTAARAVNNPELTAHCENPFNRHDWKGFEA